MAGYTRTHSTRGRCFVTSDDASSFSNSQGKGIMSSKTKGRVVFDELSDLCDTPQKDYALEAVSSDKSSDEVSPSALVRNTPYVRSGGKFSKYRGTPLPKLSAACSSADSESDTPSSYADSDTPSSYADNDTSSYADSESEYESHECLLLRKNNLKSQSRKMDPGLLVMEKESENIIQYRKEQEKKFQHEQNTARYYKSAIWRLRSGSNLDKRNELVGWMIETAENFTPSLQRETIMLAISYLDRFLNKDIVNVIIMDKYLVGAACLLSAAKYEEARRGLPSVKDFVLLVGNGCTKEKLIAQEWEVLKCLGFDMGAPTINWFLEYFCAKAKLREANPKFKLAMMLSEFPLMYPVTFLKYRPSEIAATCLYLAHLIIDNSSWSHELQQITGYTESDLSACMDDLHQHFTELPTTPELQEFTPEVVS